MENQKQYQIIIRKAKKMNHKEKAKELVDNQLLIQWECAKMVNKDLAKQCALICVDEILKTYNENDGLLVLEWLEVKQEIKEI